MGLTIQYSQQVVGEENKELSPACISTRVVLGMIPRPTKHS